MECVEWYITCRSLLESECFWHIVDKAYELASGDSLLYIGGISREFKLLIVTLIFSKYVFGSFLFVLFQEL